MKIKLVRMKDRRTSDVLYFPVVESLALGYLTSNLRRYKFNTEIIDEEILNLSKEEIIKKLNSADLIGFTAIAKPQIYDIINIIKEIRKNNKKVHITIGGQFATFMYKELLGLENIFDSVILYEGEETIVELAKYLKENKSINKIKGLTYKEGNKIIKNELRPLINNLEEMPFPARDLIPKIMEKGGLAVISSSRGCYNRCSYCTISQFYNDLKGNPFRIRSAENVIKELKELKENYPNLKDIWFVDDNFIIPGRRGFKRTKEICKEIKNLGLKFDIYLRANDVNKDLLKLLKESGIRSIFIGAESGCDNTLQNIFNKNINVKQTKEAILSCKKFGINVDPGFIMFHPWSTLEEIEQNIEFLKEIGNYTSYGILSFLTAYKFTPIGKRMLSGELKYKKSRIKKKTFLRDDVPYEIIDTKTELLLDLSLKAFEKFREYPKALFELKRYIRLSDRKEVKEFYNKKLTIFNKLTMKYFKKLFLYLKNHTLDKKDLIVFFNNICRDIKKETQNNIEEIYNFVD